MVTELQGQDSNDRRVHPRGMEFVPIEPLFRGAFQGNMRRMEFMVGQQVRVKLGQTSGVVTKKLAAFQDMYVIQLDGNHIPPKKLAHESDLELMRLADNRQSA